MRSAQYRANHLNPLSFIQTNSEAPRESSTGSALVSDCFPARSRRGLADALAKFERERRCEIAVQKADRRARAVGHARGQDVSPARDERGQYLFAAGFGAVAGGVRRQRHASGHAARRRETVAGKSLHAGDPDLYTLFRSNGAAEIEVASFASTPIEYAITVLEWPSTSASTATVEAEQNDSWSEANEFKLGQTVWASADDKPYILPLNDSKPARGASPYAQQPDLASDRLPEGGVDWFKFTYEGAEPKLVHFELDLL